MGRRWRAWRTLAQRTLDAGDRTPYGACASFVRLACYDDERGCGHMRYYTQGAIGLVFGPSRTSAQAGVQTVKFGESIAVSA
ncbi:hypothetical protein BD626DRAFT_483719 [Schizophyllum amplum]|uniref:Uncharacterized protein n=1 Tax=Schizophyllum amplum TaxID=97359 RepID=A0A550CPM7_9AGAR|nr:hypothetical protein BD626DRAFT_483719 [Auriculariopsis ampla]